MVNAPSESFPPATATCGIGTFGSRVEVCCETGLTETEPQPNGRYLVQARRSLSRRYAYF